MEPEKRLPGKVAIVTGGASGIGSETARTFARHGASVVLCDLQDELGLTVAGEIVAAGGVGEYRRLDVTQEDGWSALVADVQATHGHIDILCNIAGIASGIDAVTGAKTSMTLPGLSLDSWNQVMAVNAAGVFLGTKAVYETGGRRLNRQHFVDLRNRRLFRQRRLQRVERRGTDFLQVGGAAICERPDPRELRASWVRRYPFGTARAFGEREREGADGRHALGSVWQAIRHRARLPLFGIRRRGLGDRQRVGNRWRHDGELTARGDPAISEFVHEAHDNSLLRPSDATAV
jgi:short chain dehydrogenase